MHERPTPADAADVYRQILVSNPRNAEALNQLGTIEAQRQNALGGLALIERAIACDAVNAGFYANKGNVLQLLGRFDDALASYDRALAIKADYLLVLFNRGHVLHQLRRFDDALASYDRALSVKPGHADVLLHRGLTLRELKRFEEAIASIDMALAIKPNLSGAALHRELTELESGRLTRHPPLAARALFDEIAPQYDTIMLEGLSYRGHIHLRELADRVLPRALRGAHILDLGAGTGLAAALFRDLAEGGRIDGIDVSPRMVEIARRRGIYNDLIVGDLEPILVQQGRAYDLIIAADTMIYFGDMRSALSAVIQRLKPGGFFIFTCESKLGDGWERTPANRFRHSASYLRDAAANAGFVFAAVDECYLRNQAEAPVGGLAVACRKPAATAT